MMSWRKEFNAETNILVREEYGETIDAETGEIVQTTVQTKRFYGEQPFIRLNKSLSWEIFSDLGRNSYRILMFLFFKVGKDTNIYHAAGSSIAKVLRISKSSFEESMKELRIKDIVRSAGHCAWMLNPTIGTGCEEEKRLLLQKKYDSLKKSSASNKRSVKEDVNRQSV